MKDSNPNKGAVWYILGAVALLGGVRLVRRGASEHWLSPWRHGVLGGFSAGSGLALLALLEARRAQPEDDAREAGLSFAKRVIASIPFKKGMAASAAVD